MAGFVKVVHENERTGLLQALLPIRVYKLQAAERWMEIHRPDMYTETQPESRVRQASTITGNLYRLNLLAP